MVVGSSTRPLGDAFMSTLEELLLVNRSYRRFDEGRPVDEATLLRLGAPALCEIGEQ